MLFDEEIEAWKYGPVVPSVYYSFSHHGRDPIEIPHAMIDIEANKEKTPFTEKGDAQVTQTLGTVWNFYKDFEPSLLIKLTHAEDAPWYQHYEKGERNVIPDKAIAAHFKMVKQYIEKKQQAENG